MVNKLRISAVEWESKTAVIYRYIGGEGTIH